MDFGGFAFPIRKRGHFRTDDFFNGFHQDFDSAIDQVMSRFGGRSLLADQFSSYRKLKDRLREDKDFSPNDGDGVADHAAASISETKDNYVIVLDMSDYVQGSMSVETKGRYTVVEANCNGNIFRRKYPLPAGTNYEGVAAALSDEGILTITAPKKKSATPKTSVTSIADDSFPGLRIDEGQSDRKDSIASGGTTSGDTKVDSATCDPQSPPPDDRKLSINKKGKFFQDQYFENVWQDFEKAMDEMVDKETKKKEVKNTNREQVAKQLQKEWLQQAQEKEEQRLQERLKRRQQKEEFIKKALDVERPTFDRLNSYQNLRQWAPKDSQAATLTKDENGYKIVMDVKDFANEGDVNIKGTDEGLLVKGTKGPITFERSFTLPGLSDPEKVSASMSEDGILTITAPVS